MLEWCVCCTDVTVIVCAAGSICVFSNPFYSQCLAGTSIVAPTSASSVTGSATSTAAASPTAIPSGFVKTSGTHFTLNGKTFTVVGWACMADVCIFSSIVWFYIEQILTGLVSWSTIPPTWIKLLPTLQQQEQRWSEHGTFRIENSYVLCSCSLLGDLMKLQHLPDSVLTIKSGTELYPPSTQEQTGSRILVCFEALFYRSTEHHLQTMSLRSRRLMV